ncbi:MAG: hypothetical protein HKM03_06250 [Steroidobacteraceae bacterium]|nr:hypothetical protein [Steroidobacteraceae bacterium]
MDIKVAKFAGIVGLALAVLVTGRSMAASGCLPLQSPVSPTEFLRLLVQHFLPQVHTVGPVPPSSPAGGACYAHATIFFAPRGQGQPAMADGSQALRATSVSHFTAVRRDPTMWENLSRGETA